MGLAGFLISSPVATTCLQEVQEAVCREALALVASARYLG